MVLVTRAQELDDMDSNPSSATSLLVVMVQENVLEQMAQRPEAWSTALCYSHIYIVFQVSKY